MKIGFYTSTFNDRPFEEVLDFAAEAGFDAIEIDVSGHIKTPDKVSSVVEKVRQRGLLVCSITLTGNQLDPDKEKRRELRQRTNQFARAIGDEKVPIFVIFPGRDSTVADDANYKDFADHANGLLESTADSGLEVAIENWPGPKNDYVGTTPDGWRQLFAHIPDGRFGLEFDPSHLLRLGIDPFSALEETKDRIKILHGKDTSMDPHRLQSVGYHGGGWWRYRLPGRGMLDWSRFLRTAAKNGFDGTISIEHEDLDFGWPAKDLQARKDGERQGLEFLRATLNSR